MTDGSEVGTAVLGFGSAGASLLSDWWAATVGVVNDAFNAGQKLLSLLISNPIAFLFLLGFFLFVIPWIPYHHYGLAIAQTGYSGIVYPLVDGFLLPIAKLAAPVYEKFAEIWNFVYAVWKKLLIDFGITMLRCKGFFNFVRVSISAIVPISKAISLLINMLAQALTGVSSDIVMPKQAVGLTFSALANISDATSGIFECFCSPGSYIFDSLVVTFHNKSLRCATTNVIALVQEYLAMWFRSAFAFFKWFIRAIAWIVCRAFAGILHSDTDCGDFPPFEARQILPAAERFFELIEAEICCSANLTDDLGNTAMVLALDIGNFTEILPNDNGKIGRLVTLPTNAQYGAPIRLLMPIVEILRLSWSTTVRIIDMQGNFTGLNTERVYDSAGYACTVLADASVSFGTQFERIAALAYTLEYVPFIPGVIPVVYGPRSMNHTCLAMVELGRALVGIIAEVRSYDQYRTGSYFGCVLRELHQSLQYAVEDSTSLFHMVPAWRSCHWQIADVGDYPLPFDPDGARIPVMRCNQSLFGEELGTVLAGPGIIAEAILEYGVKVTENFQSFDAARRVTSDCIFDADIRVLRSAELVFAKVVDQIPLSVVDAKTMLNLDKQGIDTIIDFLPMAQSAKNALHALTNETIGKFLAFLNSIPYSDVFVFIPELNETRNVGLADLIPIFFPIRTLPPLLGELSVTIVEIARFLAATVHTGNFSEWKFDPRVIDRLLAAEYRLANVTASSAVRPMCMVRELIRQRGCDSLFINISAFNFSKCVPELLPCPEEALAGLLRALANAATTVPRLILHPEDFTDEFFDRTICELETATWDLGEAFATWDFTADVPIWGTHLDINGQIITSSTTFAIVKVLGMANEALIELLKVIRGYGYQSFPPCDIDRPFFDPLSHVCAFCSNCVHPDECCPTGTICCMDSGKCGRQCPNVQAIVDSIHNATGALASLVDALSNVGNVIDPQVQNAIEHGGLVPVTILKELFDLILLPQVDPTASYEEGMSNILCAATEFSKAASSFLVLPIAIPGRLISSIADLLQAEDLGNLLRNGTSNLANKTAIVVDTYGEVAVEAARVVFRVVGSLFDLGNDFGARSFDEWLTEAVDGFCRVEQRALLVPFATQEFIRSIDISGNDLFCEFGTFFGALANVTVTLVAEVIGAVGSITGSSILNKGFDVGAIIDSVRLLAIQVANILSKILYSVFWVFVTDPDARNTMHDVFDSMGFVVYAILNAAISLVTSVANAFGMIISTFQELVGPINIVCGLSSNPYDIISPLFLALTTFLHAISGLLKYISQTLADILNAIADLIDMFFVDPNSPFVIFVTSLFKLMFAFIKIILSFFTGGDIGAAINDFLSQFLSFLDTILDIIVNIIVGFIDHVIFQDITIGGYGVVGCILHFGDCIGGLILDILGLSPRTDVPYDPSVVPKDSTKILVVAHMFPHGDSCVATMTELAANYVLHEQAIYECMQQHSDTTSFCENATVVDPPSWWLVWRASLCLDRFVKNGYGEPYGLFLTEDDLISCSSGSDSAPSGDDIVVETRDDRTIVGDECSYDGSSADAVCRFDAITKTADRVKATISALLVAATNPNGAVAGQLRLRQADSIDEQDVAMMSQYLGQAAGGVKAATLKLLRFAIEKTYPEKNSTATVDAIIAALSQTANILSLSLGITANNQQQPVEEEYQNPRDYLDATTSSIFESVRYIQNHDERELHKALIANKVARHSRLQPRADQTFRKDLCGHTIADQAGYWTNPNASQSTCPTTCPICNVPDAWYIVASMCPVEACPDVMAAYPELRAGCARVCASAVQTPFFVKACVSMVLPGDPAAGEIWSVALALQLWFKGYNGTTPSETFDIAKALTDTDIQTIFDWDGPSGPLNSADLCTHVGRYGRPPSEFCNRQCDVNLNSSLIYRVFVNNETLLTNEVAKKFLVDACSSFCSFYDPRCKAPARLIECTPGISSAMMCTHVCDVVYPRSTEFTPTMFVETTCQSKTLTCAPLPANLASTYDSACRCPATWDHADANDTKCLCSYSLAGTPASYDDTAYNVLQFLCPYVARSGLNHFFNALDYRVLSDAERVKQASFVSAALTHTYFNTTQIASEAGVPVVFNSITYPPLIGLPSDPVVGPTTTNTVCSLTTVVVPHQLCGESFECTEMAVSFCTTETVCEAWSDPTQDTHVVTVSFAQVRTISATWHYPTSTFAGNRSADDCFDSGSIGRCNDTVCFPNATYVNPAPSSTCNRDLHCQRGWFCPASKTCEARGLGDMTRTYTNTFSFIARHDFVSNLPPNTGSACFNRSNCRYGPAWCINATIVPNNATGTCPLHSTPVRPENFTIDGLRVFRITGYNLTCLNASSPCFGSTIGCLNITVACENITLCQTIQACPFLPQCRNMTYCPFCQNCTKRNLPCAAQCNASCSTTDICARVQVCPGSSPVHYTLCARNTTSGCRNVSRCGTVINDSTFQGSCVTTQVPAIGYAVPVPVPLDPNSTALPWTFTGGIVTCNIPFVNTGHFCSYFCDDGTGLASDCGALIDNGINCTWYLDEANVPTGSSYGPYAARKWFCQQLAGGLSFVDRLTFPLAGPGTVYADQVRMIAVLIPGMNATSCLSRNGAWTNISIPSGDTPTTHDACIMLAPPLGGGLPPPTYTVQPLSASDCATLKLYVENNYHQDYNAMINAYASANVAAICASPLSIFFGLGFTHFANTACSALTVLYQHPTVTAWEDPTAIDIVDPGGFVGSDNRTAPYITRSLIPFDEDEHQSMQRNEDPTRQADSVSVVTVFEDDIPEHMWLIEEIEEITNKTANNMTEDDVVAYLKTKYATQRQMRDQLPGEQHTTLHDARDDTAEEAREVYRALKTLHTRGLASCGGLGICPQVDCTIERTVATPCTRWPAPVSWTACNLTEPVCRYHWERPCETWLAQYLVVLTEEQLNDAIHNLSLALRTTRGETIGDYISFNYEGTPLGELIDAIGDAGTRLSDQIRAMKDDKIVTTQNSVEKYGFTIEEAIRALFARLELATCASMPWSRACARISEWTPSDQKTLKAESLRALRSIEATTFVEAVRESVNPKIRDTLLPPLSTLTFECYFLCGYDYEELMTKSCLWQAVDRHGVVGDIFDSVNSARLTACSALNIGNGTDLFIANISDYLPDLSLLPFRRMHVDISPPTEINTIISKVQTIISRLVSCIFGISTSSLSTEELAFSIGAGIFGFSNASDFQNAIADWLLITNRDPDAGPVGGLFWVLFFTPLGTNCAALNGTYKILGIPLYSPFWLPQLPTEAGNVTVAILQFLDDHKFIVPTSMIIDPSGCGEITTFSIPLSPASHCFPSFENCGERLGFKTVYDYIFMLLDIVFPSAPNSTIPRLFASITQTSSYLTKYANVTQLPDFQDRLYCLVVVGIPWLIWWSLVGSVAIVGVIYLGYIFLGLAKAAILAAVTTLAVLMSLAGRSTIPFYAWYSESLLNPRQQQDEYWDAATRQWRPLRRRQRGGVGLPPPLT